MAQHRERLLEFVNRLKELCDGTTPEGLSVDLSSDTGIEQALDDILRVLRVRLREQGDPSGSVALLALDAMEFKNELRTTVYLRQLVPIGKLQRALAKLRTTPSVAEAIRRGPEVACRSCGFQAAVLVQVDGGLVVPASAWSERDPNWFAKVQRRLVAADGSPMRIDDLSIEREMMRRHRPFLVEDAMNDNRPAQELRRMTGVRSYVVAPIMPEDRILGFIYAIHFEVPLDIVDRDVLWTFAEGYGYALERTILRSRMQAQAQTFNDLLHAAGEQLDAIGKATLNILEPRPGETRPGPVPQAARFVSATSSIHALLSRREIEVMELLAEGATNKVIAERLVVADSTAKAHVAQILRKLGARNRAEAVKQYVRLLYAP
jgi:DNA-binding CsgD family transcriptional regulator/GAF domain-containing protein